MQATREKRRYKEGSKIWFGKYRNSQNAPHWHDDCELIFVERGSLNIFCNGQSYTVAQNQSVFIDSEQVHFLHALSPDTIVKHIIFGNDLISAFSGGLCLSSPVLSKDYGISGLYDSLFKEYLERAPFHVNLAECAVTELIIKIFRGERVEQKENIARPVERLKPLFNEIREKYEFYNLDSAAEFMNMNPTYFCNLFHKLTGITFSQYLNYVRCENAVAILNSGEDLLMTEIAVRCGFATIRNFNRIFKEFTGYTPKTLPKDFVMRGIFTNMNETSKDPTFAECILLESSDTV